MIKLFFTVLYSFVFVVLVIMGIGMIKGAIENPKAFFGIQETK